MCTCAHTCACAAHTHTLKSSYRQDVDGLLKLDILGRFNNSTFKRFGSAPGLVTEGLERGVEDSSYQNLGE